MTTKNLKTNQLNDLQFYKKSLQKSCPLILRFLFSNLQFPKLKTRKSHSKKSKFNKITAMRLQVVIELERPQTIPVANKFGESCQLYEFLINVLNLH